MDYQNKFRETLNRKTEFGSAEEGGDYDLAEIDSDLRSFKTCVDSIGTPLNNDQNRAEVRRLRSVINRRLRDCNSKVRQKGKGVEAQQLSKQINNYVEKFEDLMKQEKEMTSQHQHSVSYNVVDYSSPQGSEAPIIQTQATAAADVVAMEKDAAELRDLEKDILDLHDIQKEIVNMVQDQGETADRIEVQVSHAANRVEKGQKRLADTVILKSRKRKLCIAISLLVGIPIVIILLIIIIVLAVHIQYFGDLNRRRVRCNGTEKASLQSIGSDLVTLRGHLNKLGRSPEPTSLRETIRNLRSQLKRKISEEQVRQSNLLEQLSGDKDELGEEQKRDWQQLQAYVSQLYHLMEEEKGRLQPHPHTGEGDEPDLGENLLQALPLSNAAQAEGDAADLDEIQRDITDLLEIQSNLNRLVHGQGKDIDLIGQCGCGSHESVERTKALGEAAVLRGSSRRKKCCIALCVLVAIAVPVIILAILIPTLIHILSS
ncbi:Syntaxin-7 [Geodia barretti]|uniref:Syntaxin-7 n=1 Tax=Geodia barretti TaxID=519541 RepID=A0AA35W7K6_GEOBA|nr:Syntaxin-7 [Geodia barretti]